MLDAQSTKICSKDNIDKLYDTLIKVVLEATEQCIPKSKFRPYQKPYWNKELTEASQYMKFKRSKWLQDGRVSYTNSYTSYRQAKNQFRRQHRHAVNLYMQRLHDEIDKAAECDQDTFWRLINCKRNKSCSSPGFEMKFDDVTYREPEIICDKWKDYFTSLYSPSENERYYSDFKIPCESQNAYYSTSLIDSENGVQEVTFNDIA